MARAATLVFLLLCILTIVGMAKTVATGQSSATNFIKSSCSATTYPALCVQSLSTYATTIRQSQHQLVQTALSVSLTSAQPTETFVSKLAKFKGLKKREYEATKDCLNQMGDCVDRLSKSIQELKHLGQAKGQDFSWRMSNAQTWVSASLTDVSTCLDGFAGEALNGKVKNSIKPRLVNVGQVISNALALINRFASKQ
ncbi:PMEI domain-containing protein [Cephalotus follicularis]|uniref:PMEI domain-containing protein n=1 Tax=Cephalotus follicularis TaxID=3775 RepID=A0A1Q3BA62_CEPFO|nr:PMEI domain-containing protein [Cephalotus follicularis]